MSGFERTAKTWRNKATTNYLISIFVPAKEQFKGLTKNKMNINQNNIQRQPPTTANRQQPPSFQSVEANFTYVAPRKYKKHHLKFYKFHARMYGIAKAALLYQIINAFEHKKFHQGTHLIYLDYSKRVLSMMMGGILSPYQVGQFLQQLNNEGFIALIAKQGRSERGNRIYRGRRYMYDLGGMDTGIISINDAQEHSCEEALIIQRVKQSCSDYNKQMKSGYLNPKTTRDLVASSHLNDITRDILTESQQRKARAKLTKKGILHKTRSRNKKFNRMTTNQWVYSTNLSALKDYQASKHANYKHTDAALNTYNDAGINLSTALYLQHQNATSFSCGGGTHNPEIGTQKYILINKSRVLDKSNTYNHEDHGFHHDFYLDVEKPIYNFDEYEKDAARYEKTKQVERKNKIINQRVREKSYFNVTNYKVFPTKKQFIQVCLKENLPFIEAEAKWDYHENYWIQHGLPDNWVSVLIVSIRRAKKKNITSKSKCRVYGMAVPAAFDVGGKQQNKSYQKPIKHKEVQHTPEKFATQESLAELRKAVGKLVH